MKNLAIMINGFNGLKKSHRLSCLDWRRMNSMKVKDKELNEKVDVLNRKCLSKNCYHPHLMRGRMIHGKGYHYEPDERYHWVCITRANNGCPV